MATRTASHSTTSDPLERTLEQIGVSLSGPDYDPVQRRYPIGDYSRFATSEPFETLRDLLNWETRLQLRPPEGWECVSRSLSSRVWQGYGQTVVLGRDGRLGPWTVTLNGEPICEDVDRREAFEAAGEEIMEISKRQHY